jgi:hypothetical protein
MIRQCARFSIATLLCISSFLLVGSLAASDVKPLQSIEFVQDTDVKCLSVAIEAGEPDKGPSTLILKALFGCVVPWHSHTAVEQPKRSLLPWLDLR